MHTNKQLKILQWNAQGITNISTLKQLELFLHQKQIDVIMLNETFLKDYHKFHLSGYKIHRHDLLDAARGGVAIAAKSSIKHSLLSPYNTKKLKTFPSQLMSMVVMLFLHLLTARNTTAALKLISKSSPHSTKNLLCLGTSTLDQLLELHQQQHCRKCFVQLATKIKFLHQPLKLAYAFSTFWSHSIYYRHYAVKFISIHLLTRCTCWSIDVGSFACHMLIDADTVDQS